MKSVEPKIACGICSAVIIILSTLVEMATGFPLISKHTIYVWILSCISTLIIYPIFSSKYDLEDNDDIKIFGFGILLVILYVCLIYYALIRPSK
jgi:Kef-type K+ transport system membrane component KefB